MWRRARWTCSAATAVLVLSVACGPASEPPDSGREGVICPSCVGGETSDFGGIMVDPCLSEVRPLTSDERETEALQQLEADLKLPIHAAFQWALPSAAQPDVVLEAEVAVAVHVDTESAVYLERSPIDPSETEPSECPDQFVPNATVTVNVDDASLALELSAYIAVSATGGPWQLSGFHDLAGVRGELDLKLDARETYEGLLELEETGGGTGRCGALRLMTRLPGEHAWVTRAEGSWSAGSCPM